MTQETGFKGPRHRRKPTEVAEDSKSNKIISRSVFSTRRIVLATLVAALGGEALYLSNRQEANRAQTNTDRRKLDEEYLEKIDEFIGNMEAGYLDFGRTLKSKLASIHNEYFRDLIINTFALVQKNESSFDTNYLRFVQHALRAGRDITCLDKDISPFFYNIVIPQHLTEQGLLARFTGALRVMQVKSDFDPKNNIDNFLFMHELVHVEQDNEIRRSKNTKAEYCDKEKDKTKDLTLDESYAYASVIEGSNAYLDGLLEKSFKNHKAAERPSVDPLVSEIMQKLNARGDQEREVKNLIVLSMVYYSEGGAKGEHLPPVFVKFIYDRIMREKR